MEILLSTLIYVWQLEYLDAQRINRVETISTEQGCHDRMLALRDQGRQITNPCQRLIRIVN